MKDYNIIITIGAIGEDSDKVLDEYSHILFFIKENLSSDNFDISVEEVGEYLD